MTDYVRPVVAEQEYRDATGAVIDYGNRWGVDGPPEDTYSVGTHPERFAALHAVADALIAHLRRSYEVTVSDEPGPERVVHVVPADNGAAPLTFVFTAHPGVWIHAGLRHDVPYPSCGCDACDETWSPVADDLEELVFAVVDGRFREAVTGTVAEPWKSFEIRAVDGSFALSGKAATSTSAPMPPDRWNAWPRRR